MAYMNESPQDYMDRESEALIDAREVLAELRFKARMMWLPVQLFPVFTALMVLSFVLDAHDAFKAVSVILMIVTGIMGVGFVCVYFEDGKNGSIPERIRSARKTVRKAESNFNKATMYYVDKNGVVQ